MKYFIIICFSGLVVLGSCSNNKKVPGGILPPEKMQAVFWDYLRADVFSTNFGSHDSSLSAIEINALMQKRVFSMHHISKKAFDESYVYYLNHRSLFKDMIDTMIVRHPREAAIPIPTLTKEIGDSAQIK